MKVLNLGNIGELCISEWEGAGLCPLESPLFIIFYLRLMHIFTVSKTLGPKIIIVKRMVRAALPALPPLPALPCPDLLTQKALC